MSVVLMVEWNTPKEETRYRKYVEYQSWRGGLAEKYAKYVDFLDKMIQEGKLKQSTWADGTGHIINWLEFDSIESFAKFWSLDEAHKRGIYRTPLVDKVRIRLLRPSLMITEDLIP